MYEMFVIAVRYGLIALATYLSTVGYFDKSLIDPLASFGLVIATIGWMLWDRVINPGKKQKKFVDPNDEIHGM